MKPIYCLMLMVFFAVLVSGCKKDSIGDENTELIYTYSIPQENSDGWKTGSAIDQGFNKEKINDLGTKMLNRFYPRIHSILIIKNKLLVFEEYYHDYTMDHVHDLRSATKSIHSILTGIAIDRGYIESVENKVYPYFSEYDSFHNWTEDKNEICIRDLLTMRSGLDSEDWQQWNSPGYEGYMRQSSDWIKFMLDLALIREPGSHFAYSSGGVIMLSGVVAKAAKMDIQSYADSVLYKPLGIEMVNWPKYAARGSDASGELKLRPRDMAKIGQLMLNKGKWEDQQILTEEWIQESTVPYVDNPTNTTWGKEYAFLWWIHEVQINGTTIKSYSASGNGGQVICVFPEHDMVVVCTGANYDKLDKGYPFALMEKFILPALLHK